MSAYYNEFDPYAAQWLRNLIAAGHIAPGDVDERSIVDVSADDVRGYTQAHFFAGIGGWSYGLRLAGWTDDRPVWTGSCPCQPFSAAGKRGGFDDDRHLWPTFYRLIDECRPAIVFGEQVASPDGLQWLDLVSVDLEGAGYAVGAADMCAAGVGAPHIRQRLFWVANAEGGRWAGKSIRQEAGGPPRGTARNGVSGWVADADDARPQGRGEPGRQRSVECAVGPGSLVGGLADGTCERWERVEGPAGADGWTGVETGRGIGVSGPVNGFWRDADWLFCRDDKWRPVEPGTFPLADGVPGRVGRLRAYGNAIVPQVAAEFIRAVMELRP